MPSYCSELIITVCFEAVLMHQFSDHLIIQPVPAASLELISSMLQCLMACWIWSATILHRKTKVLSLNGCNFLVSNRTINIDFSRVEKLDSIKFSGLSHQINKHLRIFVRITGIDDIGHRESSNRVYRSTRALFREEEETTQNYIDKELAHDAQIMLFNINGQQKLKKKISDLIFVFKIQAQFVYSLFPFICINK